MYNKYFLPTYNKHLSQDFAIEAIYIDTDRDPRWGTPSFNKTVSDKIPIISNKLSQMEEGEYLLYSDVDIVFLNPIKDLLVGELGDNDIIFSDGRGKLCTGFIFMKNNDKVRCFFKNIISNYSLNGGDQKNTKFFIKSGKADIKYKLLSSKFFNISMMRYLSKNKHFIENVEHMALKEASFIKNKLYIKLFIKEIKTFSDAIVIFHATHLVGIEEKEKWLKMMLEEF
jgi:hypothetical protein